jgi:hypothetical protein
MPTLDDLRAELELLTLDQLREFRAGDYGEILSTYNEDELRQLVLETWINYGCKALDTMTRAEIIDEIVGDVATTDEPETVAEESHIPCMWSVPCLLSNSVVESTGTVPGQVDDYRL